MVHYPHIGTGHHGLVGGRRSDPYPPIRPGNGLGRTRRYSAVLFIDAQCSVMKWCGVMLGESPYSAVQSSGVQYSSIKGGGCEGQTEVYEIVESAPAVFFKKSLE